MEEINIRCRGIIVHDGKLLLVRHVGGKDFYAFPGGHLDFGEDPQECIRRELIEELGVEPHIGRLLYVYTFMTKDGVQSVEFFFNIENGMEYLTHEGKIKSHAYEIAEVVWVTPTEVRHILPKELGIAFQNGELQNDGVRFIRG
jgi:8-oxo-dGTP diphosphatase